MHWFDQHILLFLNQFAQLSWTFDRCVYFLIVSHILKGGVLMLLVWHLWFLPDARESGRRKYILLLIIGAIIAIFVGRGLANFLPYRPRPFFNPDLLFILPHGVIPEFWSSLSSFPSDHAVLFYSISTGLLFASRRIGLLALIYTSFFICLPRVYLGLHYPTDILAGAFVGSAVTLTTIYLLRNNPLLFRLEQYATDKAAFFYPAFFLCTYQITDMFENSRKMVKFLYGFL